MAKEISNQTKEAIASIIRYQEAIEQLSPGTRQCIIEDPVGTLARLELEQKKPTEALSAARTRVKLFSISRELLTESQLDKLKDMFAEAICRTNVFSDEARDIIDHEWAFVQDQILAANVSALHTILGNIWKIPSGVKVKRGRTRQQILDGTKRMMQDMEDVAVASIPLIPGDGKDEGEFVYFKVRPGLGNDGVEQERAQRGLVRDIEMQIQHNTDHPEFADCHPNGDVWQDTDGNWYYLHFCLRYGQRSVNVRKCESTRYGSGWIGGRRQEKTKIDSPGILTLKPLTPEKFDCTIWRGPINGTGLEGPEAQDERSLCKTTFDPTQITEANLQTGLTKETGEAKYARIIQRMVQADARFAQTLFEEEGQRTLRFLYKTLGIYWLECFGTILRGQDGRPCTLGVCYNRHRSDGVWFTSLYYPDRVRNPDFPALGFET